MAQKPQGEVRICAVPEASKFAAKHGDMFDETRANARLISAAPALYAQVEKIQRLLECGAISLNGSTEGDRELFRLGIAGVLAQASFAKERKQNSLKRD